MAVFLRKSMCKLRQVFARSFGNETSKAEQQVAPEENSQDGEVANIEQRLVEKTARCRELEKYLRLQKEIHERELEADRQRKFLVENSHLDKQLSLLRQLRRSVELTTSIYQNQLDIERRKHLEIEAKHLEREIDLLGRLEGALRANEEHLRRQVAEDVLRARYEADLQRQLDNAARAMDDYACLLRRDAGHEYAG